MNRSGRWKRVLRVGGVFAVAAALGMAAAQSVVYVAADKLDVVARKHPVARVVTTVDRNAKLEVVAKEGPWYRVKVGGKDGYVFEKAVSAKPGGKAEGVALSSVKAGPVAELEQAAAVRGTSPVTLKYAGSKGLSTAGLERMFQNRQRITPDKYERFRTQSGLRGVAAANASLPEAVAAGTATSTTDAH